MQEAKQVAQHTAGPWKLSIPSGMHVLGHTYKVASILSCKTTEGRANACLIAAAPDLLVALERLCHVAELQGADTDEGGAISQARAAIAKANGA